MSVTFHLYQVAHGVTYKGKPYEFFDKKRRNEVIHDLSDEADKYFEDVYEGVPGLHDFLNLSNYMDISKSCKKNGLGKKIKEIEKTFPVQTINAKTGAYKGICVDKQVYRQGWFLKKRFFKKACTIYVATTKEEMNGFFKKYLDYSYRYCNDSDFVPARETFNIFNQYWEDGMIFVCAF